jgi:hypothetical protein
MGSKGGCYDDPVAESLLAAIKKKLVHRRTPPTRRKLTSGVFEYVELFRGHSTLGYLSPAAQFEEDSLHEQQEQPG